VSDKPQAPSVSDEYFYRCPKMGLLFLGHDKEILTSSPPQMRCPECGTTHYLGEIRGVPTEGEVTIMQRHAWLPARIGPVATEPAPHMKVHLL
jgi:hypothetical protein